MPVGRPSQWPVLFRLALDILARFEAAAGRAPRWSFGGGTALMLQIDHRESHDVDIFIDDPQNLPYLNPETQGYAVSRLPDGYSTDGASSLKLAFADLGEIDFICAGHLLDTPFRRTLVEEHAVDLETPAEIIAKKVFFRGARMQPRDMFDLAAVAERCGADYTVAALLACGHERCRSALATVDKSDPEFVRSVIGQLMYRETTAHLIPTAREITRDLLARALAA